jgi:hypothetical protein
MMFQDHGQDQESADVPTLWGYERRCQEGTVIIIITLALVVFTRTSPRALSSILLQTGVLKIIHEKFKCSNEDKRTYEHKAVRRSGLFYTLSHSSFTLSAVGV